MYLKGSMGLGITLYADSSNVTKWWADAAYGVHHNMRSHTGGTMTLGKGSIYNCSTKKKLNTKSSTEAELISADDVM